MSLEAKRSNTQADEQFMAAALAERANSDDPKALSVTQSGVGAIIVSHGQVVASSANVLPPVLREHRMLYGLQIDDADRYHIIEHAERAAIYKALIERRSLERATMYCTRYPCSDCARAIVWAGIKRVVVGSGLRGEGRWIEAQRAAREIFRQSGVRVKVLNRR